METPKIPVSRGASRLAPKTPLVVIYGTTGTGKSALAVELALRFHGEVVNADAMQMYAGLPIITNKLPAPDQRGVPHHLLGQIALSEPPMTVVVFRREATRVIREIRSRGRLPIIVGGTSYYLDGLLFPDRLAPTDCSSDRGDASEEELGSGSEQEDPILDAPVEVMHAKLREVDPVSARRWHPREARKIRTSLAIYLRTGRPASAVYAEQKRQQEERLAQLRARPEWGADGGDGDGNGDETNAPWQPLLFWLYVRPRSLMERLDKRVDQMVQDGLLDEVLAMHQFLEQSNRDLDTTRGIWPSIGFRQFEAYFEHLKLHPCPPPRNCSEGAEDPELERLKAAGIERTKIATRQYAKSQIKWMGRKTLASLAQQQRCHNAAHPVSASQPPHAAGALDRFFLLDSTSADQWHEQVLSPAASLAAQYLAGGPVLPNPRSLSATAAEVLAAGLAQAREAERPRDWRPRTCDPCGTTVVTEEQWVVHMASRRHRRVAKRRKHMALVPGRRELALVVAGADADLASDDAEDAGSESGSEGEIGIGTLFGEQPP